MSELVGRTLGRYEIQSYVGGGGMADVYKAWHPMLRISVAIKVPKPERCSDSEFVKAFLEEARIAARLRHPHIVTIHDVDEQDAVPYIVMEYVAGQDLRRLIRTPGGLQAAKVCGLFDQIAEALDYAHGQGVVHCDVKPSNILVDTQGQVKLADFGIARATVRARGEHGRRRVIGSPLYMSPEHVRGKDPDARSDIYSLGIVLFEMLTGKVPFDEGSSRETMHAQVSKPPPRPHSVRKSLPDGVDRVVLRALAKEPEKRYPAAHLMAQDLRRALLRHSPSALFLLLGATMIVLVPLAAGYLAPGCHRAISTRTLTDTVTPAATPKKTLSPTPTRMVRAATLTPAPTKTTVRATSTLVPSRTRTMATAVQSPTTQVP